MNAQITVVGLGSGDENQLTLGAIRKLEQAARLYLRTDKHLAVGLLKERGIAYQTFDSVYEEQASFADVYERIAAELVRLALAADGEVVYAVPGHPFVAERTTRLLRERCRQDHIAFAAVGGESFLDQAFLRFGFDPIDGFQLLDSAELKTGMLNPRLHTLIAQVYDAFTASDVKLALMELYPDDYPVVVGHALGVAGEERIERVPLYELDRIQGYGNLSLVWVPRAEAETGKPLHRTFARLHEIVQILRGPEGCPWDREQTHRSIRKNLIEETYEVIETIDDDDPAGMCEELGDLLLQIMLHAQMEEEEGAFNVFDVIEGLNDKLIRRHPHVFGTVGAENADEALANWNEMKAEEKRRRGIDVSALSALAGVPRDLPSLLRAYKLQKKAAAVGFDWERIEDVFAKVEEEIAELKAELDGKGDAKRQQEELGDLLFAVVNLSRFLKADPEEALARTNRKFAQRFSYMEEQLRLRGKSLEQTDLLEMETYWEEAKKVLRS